MTEVFGTLFYEGFESLQQHSDEKQVYTSRFIEYIERYEADSLLDIGAGDGEVALPISEHVTNYVAIERNPNYATLLRAGGKTVIEQLFPGDAKIEGEGEYDLVLMSHIISHITGNHRVLLPPAWESVKPGGHLLIATTRLSEQDDWSRLLDSLGLGYSEGSIATANELMENLQLRGETEVQKVTTHLKTGDVSQMIKAMSFLAASGGKTHHDRFMQKAERLERILDDYRTEEGFSFPFTHPFISTKKSLD